MTNPFVITGRYLAPEYFCDREHETAELLSNVENWRNTVLISLRRMGKSGLISHLYAQNEIKDRYETIFIDIFDTFRLEDFVLLLSKAVTARLQPMGMRLLEKFLVVVNSVKLTIATDMATGLPTVDISLGDIKNPVKTLEQLFSFLEASDKPSIVAIDEFQQIADYPDGKKHIATLRTLVQSCKKTRFIFAGSSRRMMNDLFNTPAEPFFMSCTPINLEPIDKDRYTDFVIKHFSVAGKSVSEECVRYVYDMFEGHTWFIQYVFNRLFEDADGNSPMTMQAVDEAVDYILALFAPSFQEMFVRMSERQRELLIAVSKEKKVKSATSTDFIIKYNLRSASAVQGALRPLLENETISFIDGHYFITNRFFSLWLSRRY